MNSHWLYSSWGRFLTIYLSWNLFHCSLRNKVYVLEKGLQERISSSTSMDWWKTTPSSSNFYLVVKFLVLFSNVTLSYSFSYFNCFLSSRCYISKLMNFSYKFNKCCSHCAIEPYAVFISLSYFSATITFHFMDSNLASSNWAMRSSMIG